VRPAGLVYGKHASRFRIPRDERKPRATANWNAWKHLRRPTALLAPARPLRRLCLYLSALKIDQSHEFVRAVNSLVIQRKPHRNRVRLQRLQEQVGDRQGPAHSHEIRRASKLSSRPARFSRSATHCAARRTSSAWASVVETEGIRRSSMNSSTYRCWFSWRTPCQVILTLMRVHCPTLPCRMAAGSMRTPSVAGARLSRVARIASCTGCAIRRRRAARQDRKREAIISGGVTSAALGQPTSLSGYFFSTGCTQPAVRMPGDGRKLK
jgi:hypothetical protein